jgi:hypothetical protein
MNIYGRVLADIDDKTLQAGVVKLVSEATFWPKPAEIRRACLDMVTPLGLTAGEAWATVQQYIRDWPGTDGLRGRYRNGEHIDPPALPDMVQKAVDAVGGMSYLRLSENVMSDRARFMDVYQVFAQRKQEQTRMLPEVRQAIEAITERKRLRLPDAARIEAGERVA